MNSKRTVLIIAEISVIAALAIAFDYIAQITTGYMFPVGGSIGVQMVPVALISYRRGILSGMATGLIIGVIQFSYGGWYLNFAQFLLDYPLPYMLVGLASGITYLYKRKVNMFTIIVGTIIGGLLKYFSHYLSGVIFWKQMSDYQVFGHNYGDTTFNYNSWSFFYNATYMIPSIILSTVVITIIFKYAKQLFILEQNNASTLDI